MDSIRLMHDLVNLLKAAGEPSRLRILAILDTHELTVSELVTVLGQSQPRVSRHLRVLSDAGLVRRQSEGTSAFYRIDRDGPNASVIRHILEAADATDGELARDAERLRRLRDERAEVAATYFREVAADWDRVRDRHVPDAAIEAALTRVLASQEIGDLLDLGTGTGRVLEVAGPQVRRGLGIDINRDMLAVARTRLEAAALPHCRVRMGDIYGLDLPAGSMDAAVMHHVLHFLDEPRAAIAEAARTLRPAGLLVIIDFAPHTLEILRTDYNHVRLGFATGELEAWCIDAGLTDLNAEHFTADSDTTEETLTVTMWTAQQRSDAPVSRQLEVA